MLGTRIASLRQNCGLSQAELAQKLHISTSTVGMYEQGRREPSVDMLLTNSRKIQPEHYLNQCSDRKDWQETERKKVSRDTVIMSLPCSNATDARSREQLPLRAGMKVDVLGTICNTQGNTWYQVAFEGQKGYVHAPHLEEMGFFEKLWDSLLG